MSTSISGHTKALALLGNPVEHSMSPALHNASFEHLGIDAIYLAHCVLPEQLKNAALGLKQFGYIGYNVTAPYKNEILAFLDDVSTSAKLIGSVNTVVHKDGKSVGYNTDALSFTDTLRHHDYLVAGKRLVIADIRAEGPAYAAQAALEGAEHIIILTTDELIERAQNNYERLAHETASTIEVFDISLPNTYLHLIEQAHIFCNASRIGSEPESYKTPLDASLIHSDMLLVDSVYQPRTTRLMKDGTMLGCEVIGGLELLLNQAALAEKIWFGCDMPKDVVSELVN